MLKRFDRYLAGLIVVPLVATLLVSAMLLLLDKMLKLFDFVVNEGGPVSVVWRMLGNMIPEYLSLGIPIGLVLGIILSFRKLALNSELDSVSSSGVSYLRLLKVPMAFAVVLMALNVLIVGFLQPYSRYAYEGLRFELRSGALGASIKVGEFANMGKGFTLRVDEAQNAGRDLMGIFAHTSTKSGSAMTAMAEKGQFLATDDPNVILFRLTNGVLVQTRPGDASPRLLNFNLHDIPIDLPEIEAFRARGGRELELTLPELYSLSGDPAIDAATRREYRANLHRRLIQPFLLLVLPFFAMALAVPAKRNSSALGVFIGVIGLVVYNEVSEAGERMAVRGELDPVLAQWVPFTIFTLTSLAMFYRLAYVAGPPPLASLDHWIAKQTKAIIKLFPKRRKPSRKSRQASAAGEAR